MIKKIICIALVLLLVGMVFCACKKDGDTTDTTDTTDTKEAVTTTADDAENDGAESEDPSGSGETNAPGSETEDAGGNTEGDKLGEYTPDDNSNASFGEGDGDPALNEYSKPY